MMAQMGGAGGADLDEGNSSEDEAAEADEGKEENGEEKSEEKNDDMPSLESVCR
jgi:hypothetical protein